MRKRRGVGIRTLEVIDDPDYAEVFEVVGRADDRSAEQRARDDLEGAPSLLRTLVVVAQRGVLRLRLGPLGDPGHVLGWRGRVSEPNLVARS